MAFEKIKEISKKVGLYPQLREAHRFLLRKDLIRAEKGAKKLYSEFVGKGDLVFDIGANFGEKARVFLKLGAKVIAFEPQEKCAAELKARYSHEKEFILVKAAIGSEIGEKTLFVRSHDTNSGLVEEWEEEIVSTEKVQVSTLETMVSKYGRPDFLKVDVEGYEYEVLKTLRTSVPFVSFEYTSVQNKFAVAIQCLDHLSTLGTIRLNATAKESLDFIYNQWMGLEDFLSDFQKRIRNNDEFRYGDLFVKTI